MNRREALEATAAVLGGSVVGSGAFLSGCSVAKRDRGDLSDDDVRLLDEIGETILPASDRSPGAKAARVGEFMRTIVRDCYDAEEERTFRAGLREVRETAQRVYARGFPELTPAQRRDLLEAFDRVAAREGEGEPVHFFSMIRELTIWGYFTSEPGVTRALRYNPVPGRFEGCVEYRPGERAWA